jgi:hypothetical protein
MPDKILEERWLDNCKLEIGLNAQVCKILQAIRNEQLDLKAKCLPYTPVGFSPTVIAPSVTDEINKALDPAYSPAASKKAPIYGITRMFTVGHTDAPYTKVYVAIVSKRNFKNFYVQEEVLLCDYNKPVFTLTELKDVEASVKAVLGL